MATPTPPISGSYPLRTCKLTLFSTILQYPMVTLIYSFTRHPFLKQTSPCTHTCTRTCTHTHTHTHRAWSCLCDCSCCSLTPNTPFSPFCLSNPTHPRCNESPTFSTKTSQVSLDQGLSPLALLTFTVVGSVLCTVGCSAVSLASTL